MQFKSSQRLLNPAKRHLNDDEQNVPIFPLLEANRLPSNTGQHILQRPLQNIKSGVTPNKYYDIVPRPSGRQDMRTREWRAYMNGQKEAGLCSFFHAYPTYSQDGKTCHVDIEKMVRRRLFHGIPRPITNLKVRKLCSQSRKRRNVATQNAENFQTLRDTEEIREDVYKTLRKELYENVVADIKRDVTPTIMKQIHEEIKRSEHRELESFRIKTIEKTKEKISDEIQQTAQNMRNRKVVEMVKRITNEVMEEGDTIRQQLHREMIERITNEVIEEEEDNRRQLGDGRNGRGRVI
uniref:Uncharacterized protein n=1 Tax=Panagrolaimus superbus TaxID=310955 RepID=A0A914Y187_9BILA